MLVNITKSTPVFRYILVENSLFSFTCVYMCILEKNKCFKFTQLSSLGTLRGLSLPPHGNKSTKARMARVDTDQCDQIRPFFAMVYFGQFLKLQM
jgi:hypothetical protein